MAGRNQVKRQNSSLNVRRNFRSRGRRRSCVSANCENLREFLRVKSAREQKHLRTRTRTRTSIGNAGFKDIAALVRGFLICRLNDVEKAAEGCRSPGR